MIVVSLAVAQSFLITSKRTEQCGTAQFYYQMLDYLGNTEMQKCWICVQTWDSVPLLLFGKMISQSRELQIWQSKWNIVLFRN